VADAPTILATTMGFHRGGRCWEPGPVFDFAFELAGRPERPRVCFVATAGGDQASSISGFYGAFAGTQVRSSHLALFDMPCVEDVAAHLLGQDVIWVDRGSRVECPQHSGTVTVRKNAADCRWRRRVPACRGLASGRVTGRRRRGAGERVHL
jgi:hypothetical protein